MKVFISHSSLDKWIARQIAAELAQRDVDSFLDEKDIETGDSIDDAIDTNLADCDELLMLLSPASLSSSWVLIEVGGARALKKRLVPILFHVGQNELPTALSKGLARDLNDIEKYFEEVVARGEQSEPERADAALEELHAKTTQRVPLPEPSFSVGDLVLLPSSVPRYTIARNGADVGWNDSMTEHLGARAMILAVDDDGTVRVDADGGQWWWLMDWLTAVEPA